MANKQRIWKLAKLAYRWVLRPILKKAIADPDSEIDEAVLLILDKLFQYK